MFTYSCTQSPPLLFKLPRTLKTCCCNWKEQLASPLGGLTSEVWSAKEVRPSIMQYFNIGAIEKELITFSELSLLANIFLYVMTNVQFALIHVQNCLYSKGKNIVWCWIYSKPINYCTWKNLNFLWYFSFHELLSKTGSASVELVNTYNCCQRFLVLLWLFALTNKKIK